eukprot:TRINITY_DN1090_c0_g2_i2.p1 TRINITY_DN1090_c0_g2~~TRINITY_DN1090_c0_g2_i2.p1  ORF type:complete len:169 (+),score=19.99 TRINITY_DN1090_c0_g2_i2:458-964(+)
MIHIFYAAIDSQLKELNGWFSEHAVELLIFSLALDPRNAHESFRGNDICKLVNNFYSQDFTKNEKMQLRMQLHHYEYNVVRHSDFKKLLIVSDLCQWLVKTRRSTVYQLVFKVIKLVLTLSISIATTKRSFSTMNIVKTRLCNKMEDDFLSDSLIVYIEREIAEKLST